MNYSFSKLLYRKENKNFAKQRFFFPTASLEVTFTDPW